MSNKHFEENLYALLISIICKVTPEEAFRRLEHAHIRNKHRFDITDEDILEMIRLKLSEKLSYDQIGRMYGLSGDAIYKRIIRYTQKLAG